MKTKKHKMVGGVIPVFTPNDQSVQNPFIYNTYNVVYNGSLINYDETYTVTLELKDDFSAFTPHDLTPNEIDEYIQTQKMNVFNFNPKEDLQIDMPKLNLNLLDLKLFNIIPDFSDKMNTLLKIFVKNDTFREFIKGSYSPFSITRDNTFNELRGQYNLFHKYTFINKFYELIDILLNIEGDDNIKTELMKIYDNNTTKFINCSDYMTFLNTFCNYKTFFKNKTYDDTTINPQEKTYEYYSEQNGFTKDLYGVVDKNTELDTKKTNTNTKKQKTALEKTIDIYLDKELKPINMYKKIFKIINDSKEPTSNYYTECKQLTDDIGMDLVSFFILFYVYQRMNKPSLQIADLSIQLFQISKKNFISNLLQDKPYIIVINNNDVFDNYPKITDYTCFYTKKKGSFPGCAERGLFEFVKFISFDAASGNSFKATEDIFINKNIMNFINTKSKDIFANKTDDQELFAEFNSYISGDNRIKDVDYNYRDKTNIPSFAFMTALRNIIDFKKLKENIIIKPYKKNIRYEHESILLVSNSETNIELIIEILEQHVKVDFKKKVNTILSFKLINNLSLRYCVNNGIQLEEIDTQNVTNMDDLFMDVNNNIDYDSDNDDYVDDTNNTLYSQNIGNWNTENVTSMKKMFYGCSTFNQNIGGWNVKNVTNMERMFEGCLIFNQNIGGWNTENVTNMIGMFLNCNNFNNGNQPLNWNVENVTNMEKMFYYCQNFNQNLNGWKIKKDTNMQQMFYYCSRFEEKNIEKWGLSKKEKDKIMNKNLFSWFFNRVGCIRCKKGGKKTRKKKHRKRVTSTQKKFGTNNQMY